MKAIILAGGFGTRLKHVLPNTPKPMADINGRPFLDVLIANLEEQGFKEFVISVHHMGDQICDYFASRKNVICVTEDEPLGTGGAIVHSMREAKISGNVAVMNGDSFLDIDYKDFFKAHGSKNISLALREVEDTGRYGRVEVDEEIITDFREKGVTGRGLINTGFYIINADWLMEQDLPQKFSIELDFYLPKIKEIKPGYFIVNSYFIDIGIPEDYERAKRELKF